jgi:hypothetical protein
MAQVRRNVSPQSTVSNGSNGSSARESQAPSGPPEEAIARRAYEKYLARGQVHGLDQEDWAEAQRELIQELSGAQQTPSRSS